MSTIILLDEPSEAQEVLVSQEVELTLRPGSWSFLPRAFPFALNSL